MVTKLPHLNSGEIDAMSARPNRAGCATWFLLIFNTDKPGSLLPTKSGSPVLTFKNGHQIKLRALLQWGSSVTCAL